MLMDEVRGEAILRKLPTEVRNTLSPVQMDAIRRAATALPIRRHPIDSRTSFRLPFLGGVYLVVLLGRERRSARRRALDRTTRPVDRISQAVLVVLGTSALLMAVLIGILFENAILSG